MDSKDKKNISVMIKNLAKMKTSNAMEGLGWETREKINKIIKEQIEILEIESKNEIELIRDMKKYNV